jgi:predicted DNA-binding transcriptional regulator AlpA
LAFFLGDSWAISLIVRTLQGDEKEAMNKQQSEFSALLTAKEAGTRFRVSLSWLAKARMRGDGPPYIKIGRSIRYAEAALIQWMKSRQRLSTSEQ